MAQANRLQETNTVAFLLGYNPAPVDPFLSQITSGLISRLYAHKKKLLFYGQPYHVSADELYQDLIHNCDGLIFIPPPDMALNVLLAQSDFPAVAIADRCPEIVSVIVDDETGAFMLAEHLSIRGHHRVLYRKDLQNHESAVRRYQAFDQAAKYLGIEVLATLPSNTSGGISAEEERLLLAAPGKRPTAVVSWADNYSYPVLRFCKQHHLQVPKEIAVAGFDGGPMHIEAARRLTTIQAPWLPVAEKAVDLLVQLIGKEEVPRENVFPVDLVIGDTT